MNAKEVLNKVFGYPEFRGQQNEVIEKTLAGNHTLVLMPTGMGKSLCYQIPARIFPNLTLVISPLIALMKDQVDAARKKGLQCCYINSSLSRQERLNQYQGLAEKRFELVYVTPERFQKQEFREAIAKNKIDLLAIDEAHCISQWGHDFRPDYTRIGEFREFLSNPTTMALTATATPSVQKDIIKQMHLGTDQVVQFSHGIHRPNLWLGVESLHGRESKVDTFLKYREKANGPTIVYFSLIDSLDKFSQLIGKKKVRHLNYHGDLSNRDRKSIQNEFMKSSDGLILATSAFGLGVDKEDVRMVVHAEVPGSLEAYYQEVGRAGRDGKEAIGVLLFDEDDITIQMDFIKWSNPDPQFITTIYHLVDRNQARVNAEGYDFLRSQMNFYNKRDFRAETAINLLQRWDFLEGSIEQRNLKPVRTPVGDFLDPELAAKRLKSQQEKLLTMLQYAKYSNCKKKQIAEYFGDTQKIPCNKCDHCTNPE